MTHYDGRFGESDCNKCAALDYSNKMRKARCISRPHCSTKVEVLQGGVRGFCHLQLPTQMWPPIPTYSAELFTQRHFGARLATEHFPSKEAKMDRVVCYFEVSLYAHSTSELLSTCSYESPPSHDSCDETCRKPRSLQTYDILTFS